MLNFNQVEMSVIGDYAAADIERLYQELVAIGSKRIRLLGDWAQIEATPGVYTWAGLDDAIKPALAHGIRPLLCISTPMPAGATPESYGALCKAVAQKYGTSIDVECFNEMNNAAFFPNADAALYVRYLQAAHTAIKAVEPTMVVVSGGIMAAVDWVGLVESVKFVKQMYAAGAKGYFDVLAYHPYTGNPSTFIPDDPTATEQFIVDSDDIYDVMVANGDGHLKMWWTEFGFGVGTTATTVTQAVQAKWLADEHALGLTKPYLDPTGMFVYDYRNSGSDNAGNNALGVANWDWSHKLAWTTVQAINAQGDTVTPEQAAQLAQILENQQTILAIVGDNQTQLRGPGLTGWAQNGQNAKGENLTMVDTLSVNEPTNVGSLGATIAAIAAKLGVVVPKKV